MNTKILIIGLLAFSLILFGCAKGGTTGAPGSVGGGQGAVGSAPSGGDVAPAGETEGAGTTEPEAGGEPGAPAETQTGGDVEPAPENTSEPDLGGLFNIDTVQPESGSGYDIPAAGEE